MLCPGDAGDERRAQDVVRGHEQADARPSGEAGQGGGIEVLRDIIGHDRPEDGQALDGHQPHGQGRCGSLCAAVPRRREEAQSCHRRDLQVKKGW